MPLASRDDPALQIAALHSTKLLAPAIVSVVQEKEGTDFTWDNGYCTWNLVTVSLCQLQAHVCIFIALRESTGQHSTAPHVETAARSTGNYRRAKSRSAPRIDKARHHSNVLDMARIKRGGKEHCAAKRKGGFPDDGFHHGTKLRAKKMATHMAYPNTNVGKFKDTA